MRRSPKAHSQLHSVKTVSGKSVAKSPVIEIDHNDRHLVGLQGMSAAGIRSYLKMTSVLDTEGVRGEELDGHVIANLLFEDSTRTRTSFSVAAKRLGADVVDLISAASSVSKGETLIDTARNIEAMGVSALVIRSKQAGVAHMIAKQVSCAVINAGDGKHEHPTQALLDIYTIAKSHGRLDDFDLSGLRVAIVGDVVSSRVARSNIAGITALGGEVICVGPPAMAPGSLRSLGAQISRDLDETLTKVDAVMMLRIQFERTESGSHAPTTGKEGAPKVTGLTSVREYRHQYALTSARTLRMKPDGIVMHPGPMNRGIEVDEAVADGPRSVILKQVHHGVLVRMAVLKQLCLAS